MQLDNLGSVERKVLGAMLILADNSNNVNAKLMDIVEVIGYKNSGGALSFAIKVLERDNYLVKTGKSRYKLLI